MDLMSLVGRGEGAGGPLWRRLGQPVAAWKPNENKGSSLAFEMQTIMDAAPAPSSTISFPNLGEFCMTLKAVTTFVIQIIHVSDLGNLVSISF